ncbi:MAG: hypothetical protein LBC81_00595, partial [Tannerellaceae bacterium]|nr:hypothetical protein [Tannerellaceae bacterium]
QVGMLRKQGKWENNQLRKPPNEKNCISAHAFSRKKNNLRITNVCGRPAPFAFRRSPRAGFIPSKYLNPLFISAYC